MDPLTNLIQNEIARRGPVPFSRFMELALYAPSLGYYERPERIGRRGDFSTSVSVGPQFGAWLAQAFCQWLEPLHHTELHIVEAGADTGQLAYDILSWLQSAHPKLLQRLSYRIIEPSRERQKWQQTRLDKFAELVRWCRGWDELRPHSIHGVIFSNELLDAMPIRRIGWDKPNNSWFEWAVGFDDATTGFAWRRLALDRAEVNTLLRQAALDLPPALEQALPDKYTLDFCPAAVAWWRQAANSLAAGKLLTMDYGLTAGEILSPHRVEGTARSYRGHRHVADLLASPGEQDLTAHVNFTALRQAGVELGLTDGALLTQEQFLVGLMREVAGEGDDALPAAHTARAFNTLTHPQLFGRSFRVMIQERTVRG